MCRNLSVSLKPSSLCTQLSPAKPRHLSLRCTLLRLQAYEFLFKSYEEYLQFHQNNEPCPNVQSYSPHANKNSSEGKDIFRTKKCAVILCLLNTFHDEIQSNFSYATVTKF